MFSAVLALLVVGSWLPRIHGPLDLRWDGGVYYVLGTALAQGKGYRLLNEPGEIAAIQYPPLLPIVVAVHQLVLGSSDPIEVGSRLRLTFLIISVANIVSAYALFRIHLGIRYAFIGAMMLIPLVAGGDELGPEPLFMLASTLFVLAATTPWRGGGKLAGVFAVAAYALRAAGIALLAAWICDSLFRGKLRGAILRLTVAVLPIVAWHGYITLVEGSLAYRQPVYAYQRAAYQHHNVSYAHNLALKDPFSPALGSATIADLIQRFVSNAVLMPASVGEVVSAPRRSWDALLARTARILRLGGPAVERAKTSVLIIFGMLVIIGVVYQAVRRQFLVPAYFAAYAFVVSNTAWPINLPRYWSPLAPVLMLSSLHVVEAFHRRWRRSSYLFALLAILLVGINVLGVINTYRYSREKVEYRGRDGRPVTYRLFFYTGRFRAFDAGVDWLMQHSRSNDVVATSMPHWVYLRTGLRAVMPPADGDSIRTLALLDAVPVTYVIVGGSTAIRWAHELAFPAVRNTPEAWAPVYSAPGENVVIYRRRSEPAPR